MKNKYKGIIYYSKNIKDNDLFLKILSSNDEINSVIVYGGNSSKKKNIYQKGYFIDYTMTQKNENAPPYVTAEISQPYISNLYHDKYKLNALLSILSLINVSIIEGQNLKGFYNSIDHLIHNMIRENHWIVFYCKWLLNLLRIIGYQIDYKTNNKKNFYDFYNKSFSIKPNNNTIEFPHYFLDSKEKITFNSINSIFQIFENVFLKNHLDLINLKMPKDFIIFKKIILENLKK
tara:strand:+ start:3605 stop:4303 length:699 start_codon:yes stop_codon:yes gene_type:complete